MTCRVEAGTERHALQLGEAVTRGHRFPWRPIDGSAVGVRAAGVGVGDGAVAECVWARLWVQRHSFLSFFFFLLVFSCGCLATSKGDPSVNATLACLTG